MRRNVVILGSGMAGLGAAHALRRRAWRAVSSTSTPYPGGHTTSHILDGFVFDEGPHVSFTKNAAREIFAAAIDGKYESIDAYIDNYFDGRWVAPPGHHESAWPAAGTRGDLHPRLRGEPQAAGRPIRNYEDWLVASYGRTYAEYFPMRYTRKYHTTRRRT